MVREAMLSPKKENLIATYNKILSYRCLNPSLYCISFDSVRHSLKDDEIAIETFSFPNAEGALEYIAFTVRNNYEAPHLCTLFYENELNDELEDHELFFNGTNVASLLLKSFREELHGVKKLFFTPSGKLRQIPIEYCNVASKQMLSEKYEFYRLSSSAIIPHRNDSRRPYKSYIMYGGIDFDHLPDFDEIYDGGSVNCKLGYLEDSYRAAVEIHRFLQTAGLKGSLYTNEDASESEFKKEAWGNKQIFFIETHGATDPRQEKTPYPNALLFAGASYVMEGGIVPDGNEDGLLTTKEIEKTDMSGVDLAVISACKSALGDVDSIGASGLLSSFKKVGVNTLIMTTDDVVDYTSGEVWKVFFTNLIKGMSKRESLLDAIKNLRTMRDGFYSSPKYWTPYIMIDGLD